MHMKGKMHPGPSTRRYTKRSSRSPVHQSTVLPEAELIKAVNEHLVNHSAPEATHTLTTTRLTKKVPTNTLPNPSPPQPPPSLILWQVPSKLSALHSVPPRLHVYGSPDILGMSHCSPILSKEKSKSINHFSTGILP